MADRGADVVKVAMGIEERVLEQRGLEMAAGEDRARISVARDREEAMAGNVLKEN